MFDYIFRGKPITGPAAYVLLSSIKKVNQFSPNPTDEDIKVLEEITAKFNEEYERSFREHRDEDNVEYE